jgi:hypothetical protein
MLKGEFLPSQSPPSSILDILERRFCCPAEAWNSRKDTSLQAAEGRRKRRKTVGVASIGAIARNNKHGMVRVISMRIISPELTAITHKSKGDRHGSPEPDTYTPKLTCVGRINSIGTCIAN